jgi:hypothetical protein
MIAKWRRLFNGTNCGNTAGWPRRAIGRNIEAPGRPRDALVFSGNTSFVHDSWSAAAGWSWTAGTSTGRASPPSIGPPSLPWPDPPLKPAAARMPARAHLASDGANSSALRGVAFSACASHIAEHCRPKLLLRGLAELLLEHRDLAPRSDEAGIFVRDPA